MTYIDPSIDQTLNNSSFLRISFARFMIFFLYEVRFSLCSDSNFSLHLNESINLYLNEIKTSDFYRLLFRKTHATVHSGPRRWSKDLSLDEDTWKKIFTSLKTVCRETKLKEFQYKLIHRIVVTKKELYQS